MRHLAAIVAAVASLATLPSCIPGVGGCGGPGDHTLRVGGPIAVHLTRSDSACVVSDARTDFTFENTDVTALALQPDDANVTVRAAELDATDFAATATVSVDDVAVPVDLDLSFAADGTITGTAVRTDTGCTASYTVTGTFAPGYP